jgi:hypothetical protein
MPLEHAGDRKPSFIHSLFQHYIRTSHLTSLDSDTVSRRKGEQPGLRARLGTMGKEMPVIYTGNRKLFFQLSNL